MFCGLLVFFSSVTIPRLLLPYRRATDLLWMSYRSTLYEKYRHTLGSGSKRFLNKDVQLLEHPNKIIGRGLFAGVDMPEGTIVFVPHEDLVAERLRSVEDMRKMRDENPKLYSFHLHFGYQISEEQFYLAGKDLCEVEQDWSFFMNHSCDPTCWFAEGEEGEVMITRRDVKKGEELTYDYATSEVFLAPFPSCLCGSPLCRTVVGITDFLNIDLQQRYGGHFPPHVREMIQKSKEHKNCER